MQSKHHGAVQRSAQNPLKYYLSILLYTIINVIVRAAVLAPLACLFVFESGSSGQYFALLTPLLLILWVLPMRFSFAQALTGRHHQNPFTLKYAFNATLYGEKLSEGLLYALHIIKWMIPLLGTGYTLYYMYNDTQAFDMIKGLAEFGEAVAAGWNGFLNFIASIFGSTHTAITGGISDAIIAIIIILCFCGLLLLWGIVRNSAYRYIWAEATEFDKNPRYEARRSLRGRRFKQLVAALINLVLLAPFLIALYVILDPVQTIETFSVAYADAITAETGFPGLAISYWQLIVAFVMLYLPLVPLRRMLTAHFATGRFQQQPSKEIEQTQDQKSQQQQLLYEDKPAQTKSQS